MELEWTPADYAQKCIDFLAVTQKEKHFSCLREFLKALKEELFIEQIGVLYINRANEPTIRLWIPENKVGLKIHDSNFIDFLGKIRGSQEKYFKFLQKPQLEEEVSKNSPLEEEVILIKIPRIFEEYIGRGIQFVCIFKRLKLWTNPITENDTIEIEPLSCIVDTWAWNISHHRSLINWAFKRLQSPNLQVNAKNEAYKSLCLGMQILKRMVGVRDIIRFANIAVKMSKNPEEEVYQIFNANLTEWHSCFPSRWPPCSMFLHNDISDERKHLLKLVLKLSCWIDADEVTILNIQKSFEKEEPSLYSTHFLEIPSTLEELSKAGKKFISHDNLMPKMLLIFFFCRALDSYSDDDSIWHLGMLSYKEHSEVLSKISHLSQFLFAEIEPNDETINCIIWLISDYAHRYLGIPNRIDLKFHLFQAARSEPALHSLKGFYRDHFFHAIEVCFLGHFILEAEFPRVNPLWKKIAAIIRKPEDKTNVLRLWYIASLIHDIGYGIDVLKGTINLFKFFNSSESIKNFSSHIEECMENFSKEICNIDFADYERSDKPGEDHGVFAAIHLSSLITSISDSESSIEYDYYMPAIRAIALHNSRKHTVSFNDDPLGFLLILCDTLQEWNRISLDFSVAPLKILSLLNTNSSSIGNLSGPLKSATINSSYCIESNLFRFDQDEIHVKLEYNEKVKWDWGVLNLWIDSSDNYQRLDFSGLPKSFNVSINYLTPILDDYPKKGQSQRAFYVLRDIINATHMGFLKSWLPDKISPDGDFITNGSVSYSLKTVNDNNCEFENLKVNIKKLSEKKKITMDIDNFRGSLTRWKHFQKLKNFSGDYGTPENPQ